ncbi:MAG: hydrogen gas-evolving membrane-bound hydrogenase subunit E, partial [Phycisphaeraceae bacterium]|nr:hydrogen gas-evolving membrane-bound hydrogenase subunit E [Phycisphaeraceae bacterium]
RWIQTGHPTFYIAATLIGALLLFAASLHFDPSRLIWPDAPLFVGHHAGELFAGAALTLLGCVAAGLMLIVRSRVPRVLVLGSVGFVVTAVYYLYKAPDLALTQLSIEIVSLILFLLVLSLLPDEKPPSERRVLPRLTLALAVGAMMFYLTFTSITVDRPAMPYRDATGAPITALGEFFLRNAYFGQDTAAVDPADVYGGVVERPPATYDKTAVPADGKVGLHPGGGGHNVVNVILVDFRGLDTMGEITVLALAAMGVWTLLHRSRRRTDDEEAPA